MRCVRGDVQRRALHSRHARPRHAYSALSCRWRARRPPPHRSWTSIPRSGPSLRTSCGFPRVISWRSTRRGGEARTADTRARRGRGGRRGAHQRAEGSVLRPRSRHRAVQERPRHLADWPVQPPPGAGGSRRAHHRQGRLRRAVVPRRRLRHPPAGRRDRTDQDARSIRRRPTRSSAARRCSSRSCSSRSPRSSLAPITPLQYDDGRSRSVRVKIRRGSSRRCPSSCAAPARRGGRGISLLVEGKVRARTVHHRHARDDRLRAPPRHVRDDDARTCIRAGISTRRLRWRLPPMPATPGRVLSGLRQPLARQRAEGGVEPACAARWSDGEPAAASKTA